MRYEIEFQCSSRERVTLDADQINETENFIVFTTFHGADDEVIRDTRYSLADIFSVKGVK